MEHNEHASYERNKDLVESGFAIGPVEIVPYYGQYLCKWNGKTMLLTNDDAQHMADGAGVYDPCDIEVIMSDYEPYFEYGKI